MSTPPGPNGSPWQRPDGQSPDGNPQQNANQQSGGQSYGPPPQGQPSQYGPPPQGQPSQYGPPPQQNQPPQNQPQQYGPPPQQQGQYQQGQYPQQGQQYQQFAGQQQYPPFQGSGQQRFATSPGMHPRGGGARGVVIILVSVALAIILFVVAINILAPDKGPETYTPSPHTVVPASSEQTTASPSETESESESPSETESTSESPTPSQTETSSSSSPSPTSAAPLQRPQDFSPTGPYRSIQGLGSNRIYSQPLPKWTCTMSRKIQGSLKTWMNQAIDCMMQRYGPIVRATGNSLPRPSLQFFSGTVRTPCATLNRSVPAYYCSGDQRIYVNPDMAVKYDDYMRLGALQLIFHEFAHHVQFRTGLMKAWEVSAKESTNQRQRRLELQAECFTWGQLGSLKDYTVADREELQRLATQVQQNSEHGSKASYTYWFMRGAERTDLRWCNTWVAPTSRLT